MLPKENQGKLAQAHRLTLEVVLGQTVWKKLIKRTCLLKRRRGRGVDDDMRSEMDFVQTRIVVLDIVELLKTREDPLPHLLDLLDLICERFPPRRRSTDPPTESRELVRVSCTCHGSRLVGTIGFQLLEAAEAALGTTEQSLELVEVAFLGDHLLAAVASRLARQQNTIDTRVRVRRDIICKNQGDGIAISSLMQNCRSVQILGYVSVPRDIGREGWAALSEALSWRLHDVPFVKTGLKSYMASAERKDLRTIWECLSLSWKISRSDGSFVVFDKASGDPEMAWLRLEQFLDLTDVQWRALYPELAPAMSFEEVEERVLAAVLQVENFRRDQQQPLGAEEVQALVQAVNQAFEALHLGRLGHQNVQLLMHQLGDAMDPLQAFEAALQAHGVVLAVPGGPMQALLQVVQPLLFADAGDGAPVQENH